MVTGDGAALGSSCAIDVEPRVLDAGQLEALQALSRQVVALLEARTALRRLAAETRERERAEAEAAVAVDRFRQVFDAAPIAMAIADAGGVLVDVNQA